MNAEYQKFEEVLSMSDVMLEFLNEVVIDERIKNIKGMLNVGISVDECLVITKVPQEEWEAYKAVIDGREPIESLYTEFPDDFDEDEDI